MPSRVVIDTNVLVGAVLSARGGADREVLRRCLTGEVKPVVGVALFTEYEGVFMRSELMARSPLSETERKTLLAAFLSVCEWVKVYYLWRPNLPDEADNHLIELAVAAGSKWIVTHNTRDVDRGELLFPSIRVLTPAQLLREV